VRALRLPSLLRPAVCVPETVRISRLLRQIQETRQGLAMIVDEYGSVVGLVTVEDVVEEIVGEIRDEGEHRAELIARLPDGSVVLDGMMPLDEVARHLMDGPGSGVWPCDPSDRDSSVWGSLRILRRRDLASFSPLT
jgi:CBS domain containing-hemolysin-like protein